MHPLRFGIIACSSIAQRRFIPALLQSSRARLHRIGSRSKERAAQFAAQANCSRSGTYSEVLNDPEVDAVYISTPITDHARWVMESARHGKHIICEKPAFLSQEAARSCIDLCRRSGVRLMEGYSYKYHPQHAVVAEMMRSGAIGLPRYFEAQFTYPRPAAGDIRLNPNLHGGVFFDSFGYTLHAARMQFGSEPESIYAIKSDDSSAGVDNGACALLRFSDNRTASVFAGFDLQYRSQYAVLGARGRIALERAFSVPPDRIVQISLQNADEINTRSAGPSDHFVAMIDHFCEEIQSPGKSDFENDLLRQSKAIDAAWRSALEKRPIFLADN